MQGVRQLGRDVLYIEEKVGSLDKALKILIFLRKITLPLVTNKYILIHFLTIRSFTWHYLKIATLSEV